MFSPSKVIAGISGLAGFSVAIFAGLMAQNPATTVLTNALVAMVICQFVGWALGLVGERVIQDHLQTVTGAGAPVVPTSSPTSSTNPPAETGADAS
ncbi:MAG: hypothetical protein SFY95_11930 [Planctomycetota bacterium]|nr:hypothetical protein [Planctomycetota bacterium]